MSGFSLHPDAITDLEEIWEGHGRSDLTSKPLRFQIVRELLIAYAPDQKPLLVLAVLHGRRNPRIIASLLRERK